MTKYEYEVKERWGSTQAYAEYTEKAKGYSKKKAAEINAGLDGIMGEFAVCMSSGLAPSSPEARVLVKKLQDYITENYYTCTDEILAGLGEMYVADERFKSKIDKHGSGTAQFVSEAIKAK